MPKTANYCPICLSVHDAEIHGATTRVHAWLRKKVNAAFTTITPEDDAVCDPQILAAEAEATVS
jgi:hypothetical protein